jgi:glutamine synthetase type III
MSAKEAEARTTVMHDHYAGTVEMEALTMIDMVRGRTTA